MFRLKITFFFIGLFISVHGDCGVLDYFKSEYKALDYKYSTQENYEFDACQKFNADDDYDYFITCNDGQAVKEQKLDLLLTDVRAIEQDVVENSFLDDLKNEILSELNRNKKNLLMQIQCVQKIKTSEESLTEMCKNMKEVILKKVQIKLPKVRALMAQKDHPGKVYSAEKPRRFQVEDLTHEITKTQVPDLTEKEIKILDESTNLLEMAFTQDVLGHNFNTTRTDKGGFWESDLNCGITEETPECIEQEERFTTIPNSKECIEQIDDNQYQIKQTQTCQRLNLQISTLVNHKFKRQNAKYEEEYIDMIGDDPLLASLNLTGEEKEKDIFAGVESALMNILENSNKAIERIFSLEGEDRTELMAFDLAVEKFLKDRGPSQIMCDVSSELKSASEFDELKTDLYIGAGALIGGGVCAFSMGLGCVATVIGLEGAAIGISQNRFDKVQNEFYSGLTSGGNITDREFERDLSMYLAPLALVGGPGKILIKNASRIKESSRRIINPYFKKEQDKVLKERAGDRRNGTRVDEDDHRSRRSNQVTREQIDDIQNSLGGRDEALAKFNKYFPSNQRNLDHKDKIYLAGLADEVEKELITEIKKGYPNISDAELKRRVQARTFKVLDHVAEMCTKK